MDKDDPYWAGDKVVDLEPHQWKSERDKPREQFFGPGLGWFIEIAILWAVATVIVHYFVRN